MPVYSHSRLSTFENCPRQFYYRYVEKIKIDDEEGIDTFLGNRVHDALEQLYRDRGFGKVLTAEQLVHQFNALWKKEFHDGVVCVRKDYGPEDYRRVGEDCLRKYHARYAPFDQATTIGLEEQIHLALDKKGQYKVTGFIDRLSQRPDGVFEIHDYKTNSRLPSQEDKDQDRQLALYQIGVQNRWPDVEQVELIWHFVRFDKEIRSSRTPQQLDRLRQDTIALIDDIESREEEADFETCESALCGWCPFQHVCPVRKHLFKTESLPANRFLKDSGVKLVNRRVKIDGQIKELKGQIEQLQSEQDEVDEALLKYAEREGVQVIAGSTHEARIVQTEKIVLTTKSNEPEKYDELDKKLRRSKYWSQVSVMDVHMLRRILKGDEADPGRVRNMIDPFVQQESVTDVRLRQRQGRDDD